MFNEFDGRKLGKSGQILPKVNFKALWLFIVYGIEVKLPIMFKVGLQIIYMVSCKYELVLGVVIPCSLFFIYRVKPRKEVGGILKV